MNANAHRRGPALPSTVTDPRMLRTREALHNALLELLERKQFDKITIREIVGKAQVGYATFFRHHASKEELLNEVAAEQVGHLMKVTLPLLDASNTRIACVALCRYVGQHRATWRALLTGGASGTVREEFIRLSSEGASHIQTSGWLPVGLGAVYGVAATTEILAWWLRRPKGESSEEQIAEILDRLVVTPALGVIGSKRPSRGK